MPYAVKSISEIYRSSSESPDDALATYLDSMETDGWRLDTVTPFHPHWDDDGMPDGNHDVKLVFHR